MMDFPSHHFSLDTLNQSLRGNILNVNFRIHFILPIKIL